MTLTFHDSDIRVKFNQDKTKWSILVNENKKKNYKLK